MSAVEASWTPPARINPAIKAARWSLLVLGIFYGRFHLHRFTKKENALREKELREKPMRDAKLAEERARIIEADRKFLEDLEKSGK